MKVPFRLRRLFPRSYINWGMARVRRERTALRSAKISKEERTDRLRHLEYELQDLSEWQESLDDAALLKQAAKLRVYLDQIDFPTEHDPANDGPYHRIGTFGNRLLRTEFYGPLRKAIREREPFFRKERHEQVEMIVKVITAVTGLIGTLIGLFATFRR